MQRVYAIDHDHDVPARDLAALLGGKGAGLAEMTRSLHLSVPPGFTVSVPTCVDYLGSGWPLGLDEEIARHVDALGDSMGRYLGDPADPLLVAVRSGAPVSMPGMLDTVLNLGLNEETVAGLAHHSQDDWFAWDSYRRFLTMFATTVMGLDEQALCAAPDGGSADDLREHCRALQRCIEELAGRPVPQDPAEQLRQAVRAVFGSWGSPRARAYRERESISEELGTAVTVQAMVFGNRGPDSGTGVVFTRNPATGEARPYGDYLPKAQGEAVVSGSARTMPIAHLAEHQPAAYDELMTVLRRLEVHYRDICDVEFTLENGRLWLLQTRVGKRGATAAVRIAVQLVDDAEIALTKDEAIDRVSVPVRERARAEVLARVDHSGDEADLLAQGLGASPGRVSGRVVLTADEAADAEDPDDPVILVRRETSPEDVAGMAASAGVLTTKGGLVSHAAVVARGWDIPAVVGAGELSIEADELRSERGLVVNRGDVITIDGTSGLVWRGVVAPTKGSGGQVEDPVAELLPELGRLESWAADRERARA